MKRKEYEVIFTVTREHTFNIRVNATSPEHAKSIVRDNYLENLEENDEDYIEDFFADLEEEMVVDNELTDLDFSYIECLEK